MHLTAVLVLQSAQALFALAVVMAQIPNLDSLRWKNRVVLLFAPLSEDRQLAEQKAKFEAVGEALAKRDLKVFEITGQSDKATTLQARFGVKNGHFTVVLIGKDGSRKLKTESLVEPDVLFKKIDAMPMRRDEINKQQGTY